MAEEKKRNTNLTLLEKIDIIKNKKLFPFCQRFEYHLNTFWHFNRRTIFRQDSADWHIPAKHHCRSCVNRSQLYLFDR